MSSQLIMLVYLFWSVLGLHALRMQWYSTHIAEETGPIAAFPTHGGWSPFAGQCCRPLNLTESRDGTYDVRGAGVFFTSL